MPVSVTNKPLLFLISSLLILLSFSARAETFYIDYATVNPIGNGYVLNAKIKYPLTARVKEAIDNGITITFSQQFELIDSTPILGKYWHWNTTLWSSEIRYQLRYHALTQQYLLLDIDTHLQQNFSTLDDTLNALGRIINFNLPPEYIDEPDTLIFQLRSGIDLNSLPTPMRPGVLVSSKWQLTSPWVAAQWQ